jgi:hypothetical protein
VRLAYADPPYPGKAHIYPENTEVDHADLVARLVTYDGWALSTDERNLADVLSLCPRGVRVLAWCRPNAPPFAPNPVASWEPVICSPARSDRATVRSYLLAGVPNGHYQRDELTGQKPAAFADWLFNCLGADHGDTLDDFFPGTGIIGERWAGFSRQMRLGDYCGNGRSAAAALNKLRRTNEPLPGIAAAGYQRERRTATA